MIIIGRCLNQSDLIYLSPNSVYNYIEILHEDIFTTYTIFRTLGLKWERLREKVVLTS